MQIYLYFSSSEMNRLELKITKKQKDNINEQIFFSNCLQTKNKQR